MGTTTVSHIIPLNDLADHRRNMNGSCWCRPTKKVHETTGNILFSHNAADKREEVERDTGKAASPAKKWILVNL